jgi:hypothetical protein
MSYKDMTFCVAADNCKTALQGQCFRYFSADEEAKAMKWASSSGMEYPLVAWSDFSKSCTYYQPVDPDLELRMTDSD